MALLSGWHCCVRCTRREGTAPLRGELRKLQAQQQGLQKEVEAKRKQVGPGSVRAAMHGSFCSVRPSICSLHGCSLRPGGC